MPSRWSRFADGAQRDLALWLAFMALLSAGRVFLIAVFHDRMAAGTGFGAVLVALANGVRFDAPVAVLWAAPGLLGSAVAAFTGWTRAAGIVRQAAAGVFVFLTVLLGVITFGFFREYDDQFNHFILGVIYDDFGAVLTTVWKEYPVVWVVLGMLALDAGLFLGIAWLVRRPLVAEARLARLGAAWRAALTVALVAFLAAAGRGSVGRRPVQRKDVAVTADPFLNKAVINPYKAIEYTVTVHMRLARSSSGIRVLLPDGDIRGAARRVFGAERFRENLDECLLRSAPGAAHPPRHVFLVVMESYSAWPLAERYRALGVAGELSRLGREGLLLTGFLPAGSGTMTSLATVLTGLAEHGAPICYQPSSRQPYPTSLAHIFRELGYRTRFFYGGYLSWQRMGDFARDQDFQEVYGGGDAGSWLAGNEWGVPDERLFDLVLRKADDSAPSLNVILTVSNHPPFDVDVYGQGFPLKAMPAELAPLWDGGYTLKQIGHFWYADRCLGRFADAVEKQLPGVLLAATADHYGRRFLNTKPGLAERSLVPFLLHGPEVLKGVELPPGACGSHLDIPATLVELSAPAGFRYHALGRSVLGPEAAEPAFGSDKVIGPGFLAELTDTPSWVALAGEAAPAEGPDLKALVRREHDLQAVSWWRVLRGPALPAEPGKAKAADRR